MSKSKEALQILKRRAGYETDVDMTDVAVEKVAEELGLSKEAFTRLFTAPLGAGAKFLEWGAGKAVANPMQTFIGGLMLHQAKGEADEYQRLTKPKFPRKPRGVGIHD